PRLSQVSSRPALTIPNGKARIFHLVWSNRVGIIPGVPATTPARTATAPARTPAVPIWPADRGRTVYAAPRATDDGGLLNEFRIGWRNVKRRRCHCLGARREHSG